MHAKCQRRRVSLGNEPQDVITSGHPATTQSHPANRAPLQQQKTRNGQRSEGWGSLFRNPRLLFSQKANIRSQRYVVGGTVRRGVVCFVFCFLVGLKLYRCGQYLAIGGLAGPRLAGDALRAVLQLD